LSLGSKEAQLDANFNSVKENILRTIGATLYLYITYFFLK
jgi:hypothetical protein